MMAKRNFFHLGLAWRILLAIHHHSLSRLPLSCGTNGGNACFVGPAPSSGLCVIRSWSLIKYLTKSSHSTWRLRASTLTINGGGYMQVSICSIHWVQELHDRTKTSSTYLLPIVRLENAAESCPKPCASRMLPSESHLASWSASKSDDAHLEAAPPIGTPQRCRIASWPSWKQALET